ncbi:MAG: DRTGG domain-containing protein [Halanaerobium sp. T82-1]|nr:MAG: DRTGG domain-containing protein [Halanaerobium sp. T82-1]
MTVREFAEKYKLEIVAGNNLDVEINGVYFGDEPHDVMKMAEEGNIWLTILDGLVTVGVALLADISAVILVE